MDTIIHQHLFQGEREDASLCFISNPQIRHGNVLLHPSISKMIVLIDRHVPLHIVDAACLHGREFGGVDGEAPDLAGEECTAAEARHRHDHPVHGVHLVNNVHFHPLAEEECLQSPTSWPSPL
uniref:Uncharacterized protein n=1 Tax=Leersia perrieri TaxID=77586 RepID=A0A0D9XYV5_9ORYZ